MSILVRVYILPTTYKETKDGFDTIGVSYCIYHESVEFEIKKDVRLVYGMEGCLKIRP